MQNLLRNAEDAARNLMRQAGKLAVAAAAKEALEGKDDSGEAPSTPAYSDTVDAFWRLRTREGIPAVREVLCDLRVDLSDVF